MSRFPRGKKSRSLRDEEPPRAFVSSTDISNEFLRADLLETPVIVFDIETTGGNPDRNGITEISALRFFRGEVTAKF